MKVIAPPAGSCVERAPSPTEADPVLLLLLALSSPSPAVGADCISCCRAEGLVGCPTRLRIYGPGSGVSREGGAWRVVGTWTLDCSDGMQWEPTAQVIYDHAPADGEVLRVGYPAASTDCFHASCDLPSGACLRKDGQGGHLLRGCVDDKPLTAQRLSAAGPGGGLAVTAVAAAATPPTTRSASPAPVATASRAATSSPTPTPSAIVAPLPANTARVAPTSAWTASAVTTSTPSAPAAVRAPAPAPSSVAIAPPSSPASPAASPAAAKATSPTPTPTPTRAPAATTMTPTPTPTRAPAATTTTTAATTMTTAATTTATAATTTGSTGSQFIGSVSVRTAPMAAAPVLRSAPVDPDMAGVDPTIPGPPGASCTTSEPLRGESRRHGDLGDQARVTGDPAGAAAEYRAAITMDNCNPAAWASLGGLVLKAGHPGAAVDAFRVVNRLQPNHYGAWASLGAAYEALGQRDLARDAYQRALTLKPGLQDAASGLARLGGASPP